MTDQLNSQLSAFVDEALSEAESELLVRRLCRDTELRETLARYTLIGNVLRGDTAVPASGSFARGVMMAVDGQAVPAVTPQVPSAGRGRPLAAAAVAAMALAVVALVTLPDRESGTMAPVAALDTELAAPAPAAVVAEGVSPASYNVPFELPADRYPPGVRERLNRQLVQHLTTTGARQGLVNYRNVGYVTQVEARQ